MKIGVIGAMEEEVRWLVGRMEKTGEKTIGRRVYHLGKLGGAETVLVYSRVGKVSSASTVTTLLDVFGVDLVLFTGLAGGARPDLEVGDVVIATQLIQHDMDASALPMFKKYEIPLLGVQHFPASATYSQQALSLAEKYLAGEYKNDVEPALIEEFHLHKPKAVQGLIASGDQFIASPVKVAELRQELPGLACIEMEGAAVAQVCYEHGVPVVVIRVISDKADHSAMIDFPKFLEKVASPLSGALALAFLKSIASP